MSSSQQFLFSSLKSSTPHSARKMHIRRLYDILILSLQKGDIPRAQKAWNILSRCKETEPNAQWTTATYLLEKKGEITDDGVTRDEGYAESIEYLRSMMLQYPKERELLLRELISRLILAKKYQEATDELELYLPSFPYQDDATLHLYAGMLCLYRAQPHPDSSSASYNKILLREAQGHVERALALDVNNTSARCFLEKVCNVRSRS
ncbi:hypothetical protein FISHEDRAFT_65416 [Fistulina hepatica ATCC 64428]|nr:hypothetical protein FISHEDRAFT_65416 [Fistulina hepatica ATCC 64428]